MIELWNRWYGTMVSFQALASIAIIAVVTALSSARRRRNYFQVDFDGAGTSPMHSCTSAGTL